MHAIVQSQLEEVLAGRTSAECLTHLAQCPECCTEVASMRDHSAGMRALKVEAEPRAGFYARVMERIEAQRGASIWNLFFESVYGRRIAMASVALALLLGVYLVTSESVAEEALIPTPVTQSAPQVQEAGFPAGAQVAMPLEIPDQDGVLVQIVTFQGEVAPQAGQAAVEQ